MHNRFRPYNTSLFVNILMNREYKWIYIDIPEYDTKNIQNYFMNVFKYNNINIETTRILLSHPKINANIKDKFGHTVLDYASKNNNDELINLLRQHNAQ